MKGKKISVLTQLIIVGILLGACGSENVAKTENSAESVGELQETPTIEMTSAPAVETEQGAQTEMQQEMPDSVAAEQNMSADFYYIIEDVFNLIDPEAIVVVGMNENSPLYVGAEVDILSESGRIPSKVLAIEVYKQGLVDYVEMGSNVGVMLEGVSVEQLAPGNLLVLRDQGMVAENAFAIVSMLPMGEEQVYAELSEGQNVDVIMFADSMYADSIKATIITTDILAEAEDGDVVLLGLTFEHPIPFQDRQKVLLRDSNGNSVAAGRFVFGEE